MLSRRLILGQAMGDDASWHQLSRDMEGGNIRSTVDRFILEMRCTLTENRKEIRSKTWKDAVKRDLV